MAIATSGSSTQQLQVDNWGNLKSCVADIVSGRGDAFIESLAERLLRRTLKDINMTHKAFRFGRAATTDTALTEDDTTLNLTSTFYAIAEVQLVNSDADARVEKTLRYIPWEQFNDLTSSQKAKGEPIWWTSLNDFQDEYISIYPRVDASTATNRKARITHYTRIAAPNVDSDIIDAPEELGELLCLGAEARMLWHRERDKGTHITAFQLYNTAKEELIGADRYEPSAHPQFTLGFEPPTDSRFVP